MKYSTLRQRVWRWHFFAGLMVVPFAIVLALSGAVYLFKPQIESFTEAQINARSSGGMLSQAMAADQLVSSLKETFPDATLKRYFVSKKNDPSIEVELNVSGAIKKVWIDQFSGEVLAEVYKKEQLLEFVKNIHGELLAGNFGSYVVELMASWMIVLVVTGFVLWWPRKTKSDDTQWRVFRRCFLPNLLDVSSREMFKRLHAALGFWVGIMILVLLVSGLPWTQLWGAGFKNLQAAMNWEGPGQEFFVTLKSQQHVQERVQQQTTQHSTKTKQGQVELHSIEASGITPSQNSTQMFKDDGIDAWATNNSDEQLTSLQSQKALEKLSSVPISLQSIVDKITPMKLPPPIFIQPPKGANGVWTVRSMTQYRPDRVTIHFDKWSGDEIMRISFNDYHPIKKITSYGIALHEGALFGWFNQLLGVITALGVIVLSVSGMIMWWKRRPTGQLAAPKAINAPLSATVLAITFGFAIFLPAMAISLVGVLLLEKTWEVTRLVLKPAV